MLWKTILFASFFTLYVSPFLWGISWSSLLYKADPHPILIFDTYLDNATVNHVALIPGSLNSASNEGMYIWSTYYFMWFKNQYFTIQEQLNMGIRFFDIRVAPAFRSNDVFLASNILYTNVNLVDMIQLMIEFLKANQKEIIILYLRKDYDQRNKNFEALDGVLAEALSGYYAEPKDGEQLKDQMLSTLRGKIVLMHEDNPECYKTKTTKRVMKKTTVVPAGNGSDLDNSQPGSQVNINQHITDENQYSLTDEQKTNTKGVLGALKGNKRFIDNGAKTDATETRNIQGSSNTSNGSTQSNDTECQEGQSNINVGTSSNPQSTQVSRESETFSYTTEDTCMSWELSTNLQRYTMYSNSYKEPATKVIENYTMHAASDDTIKAIKPEGDQINPNTIQHLVMDIKLLPFPALVVARYYNSVLLSKLEAQKEKDSLKLGIILTSGATPQLIKKMLCYADKTKYQRYCEQKKN
jgi:Phosphatidylinositol-specific phospholipase C, X domain